MASWRCRGDGGPSGCCGSSQGRRRRILGRGTRRGGSGRKQGLGSRSLRARTPGARQQVSAKHRCQLGTRGSARRPACSRDWRDWRDWQRLWACSVVDVAMVFAQANPAERLCPPVPQALNCLNLKGRRLRCVVENLALQLESCFVARFCLKSGEKWRSRALDTSRWEPGLRPQARAGPGW